MLQVLQSVTEVYYKVRQVLQSVADCYYKVRQVLQSEAVIIKVRRNSSSLYIAINYSLSSILFDFADILILRNIKNLSKSCFSSL